MNELLKKHGCSNVFTVPDGLKELMSDISREVLREQPPKIFEFIANYLSALIITREHGVMAVKILDDLCDCKPSVSQHLLEIGVEDQQAKELAQIIKEEIEGFEPTEGKEKIKEYQIIKRIIHQVQLDEAMVAKVCQITRNAYRDYWYRKKTLEQALKPHPEEPWEIAAQHTLEIYKRTKPSFDELSRAAEKIQALSSKPLENIWTYFFKDVIRSEGDKILCSGEYFLYGRGSQTSVRVTHKAAYKGYYVRRNLLQHLKPKPKRGPKVNLPGPPIDISSARQIEFGPIINVKIQEDNVKAMFEERATQQQALPYEATKRLTYVEDHDVDETYDDDESRHIFASDKFVPRQATPSQFVPNQVTSSNFETREIELTQVASRISKAEIQKKRSVTMAPIPTELTEKEEIEEFITDIQEDKYISPTPSVASYEELDGNITDALEDVTDESVKEEINTTNSADELTTKAIAPGQESDHEIEDLADDEEEG